MFILFFALAIGVVVFLLLLRSISKNTKYRIRNGRGLEKIAEIIKVILLIESVIYIILFVIVIIKTLAI